jgi:recombination protein RecA
MPSAAAIRLEIETALAPRIPSALTPRQRIIRPFAPTGVAALDELLEGGLPLGAISEMTGPESSGRSSVALSFVSRLTRAGSVCAWIDVSDAFDPESAAAAGADLFRLLWVRCGVSRTRVQPSAEYKFALPEKYLIPAPVKQGLHGGGCGGHPRNEVKGLSAAVSGLLRPEAIAPRCAEPQPRIRAEREIFVSQPQQSRLLQTRARTRPGKPWARIEQALRVTDLLLQAGGFSAIVLDMAGLAAEHVSRVPMATWFRDRAAAERTHASVLLLSQYPCTKSSGELVLRFQPGAARHDEATVFTGIEHHVEIERRRFAAVQTNVVPLRKPPQSVNTAHWKSQTVWAGVR